MNDNQLNASTESTTPVEISAVEPPIEEALLDDLIEPTNTAAELASVGHEASSAAPELTEVVPIGGDEPLTAYLGAGVSAGSTTQYALPFPDPVDVPLPSGYRDAVPVAPPEPIPAYSGPAFSGPPSDPIPPIPAMMPYQPEPTRPPQRPINRHLRPSTIVWGLFVMAIGVGVILVAAGNTFDLGLAAIWLLGATGVILVVASILSGARRRRNDDYIRT